MNKQLFLAKNITHNSKATADLLADGEIGIFGLNSAIFVTEKVAAGTAYDYAQVALGKVSANKGVRFSRSIDVLPKSKHLQLVKMPYSPWVNKTYLVTTTCVGKSSNDDFVLRVNSRYGEDYSGEEDDAKSYHAQGKFATARAIYDEWARLIGLDASATVTAVATDGGLQVTPKAWDQVVKLGAEYYDNPQDPMCKTCTDCSFTITTQNEGDAGSGHLWHLRKLAREAGPWLGANYNQDRVMTNPEAKLDAAIEAIGNADILYLKWSNRNQPGGDHGQVFDVYQELFLVFPTGTTTTALETVLTQITGAPVRTSLAS